MIKYGEYQSSCRMSILPSSAALTKCCCHRKTPNNDLFWLYKRLKSKIITDQCWKKRKIQINKIVKGKRCPLLQYLLSTALKKYVYLPLAALNLKLWSGQSIYVKALSPILIKKLYRGSPPVRVLSKIQTTNRLNLKASWDSLKNWNWYIKIKGLSPKAQLLASPSHTPSIFPKNYPITLLGQIQTHKSIWL